MDKETLQYIEGKHNSFTQMYKFLKSIHTMLEGDLMILNSESEEFNKEAIGEMLTQAEEFIST